MVCYFVPLRMGTKKEFSDSFNTFTCCVGSGMENHAKYAENIYSEGADGSLYINLFIPSQLNWKARRVKLTQQTAYPEKDTSTFIIETRSAKTFGLRIRYPWWATQGVQLTVNGSAVAVTKDADGYILLQRKWKNKDVVGIRFPMNIYTEHMPDNNNRVALLYGPVVLAGQLGTTMPDPVYGTPVLLTDNHTVTDWVKPVQGKPLVFKLENVGKPYDTELAPFYKTYNQYYNVYWDYFTGNEWTERQAEYEAEKKRQQQVEAMTIDNFRIGEMQPERDHNLQASEVSYTENAFGRAGREVRKGGFFSFDMKVLPGVQNGILFTYLGDDKDRIFDILVNGVKIGTQELKGGITGRFYDVEYALPDELVKGKTTVSVRVQAYPGKTAGRVFGCRTVKK